MREGGDTHRLPIDLDLGPARLRRDHQRGQAQCVRHLSGEPCGLGLDQVSDLGDATDVAFP